MKRVTIAVCLIFAGLTLGWVSPNAQAQELRTTERVEPEMDERALRRLRADRRRRALRLLRRTSRQQNGEGAPPLDFTIQEPNFRRTFRPLIASESTAQSVRELTPDFRLSSGGPTFSVDAFETNLVNAVQNEAIGYTYAITLNKQLARMGAGGDARTSADGQIDQSPEKEMITASMSKSITAVAMLHAMRDNGVGIDDSIEPYLPDDWTRGPNINQVTFRRLFIHRSGLDRPGQGLDNLGDGDPVTAGQQPLSCCLASGNDHQAMQAVIANGVDTLDTTPEDDQHRYTNANYSLMRVMLPKVIGSQNEVDSLSQTFPVGAVYGAFYVDYVQENIFSKAGIVKLSCAPFESAGQRTLVYDLNTPNNGGWDAGNWLEACGANGWYMSAVDMARFLVYLRYTEDILDNDTKDMMNNLFLGWHDPSVFVAHVDGVFGNYRGHGGNFGVETCMMNFNIQVEAVVMVNSDNGVFGSHLCQALKNAYDQAWE
ncbi:MAG: serine hydrolase domain-containing protein [Pseudomonadota bacterium]